MITQLQTSPHKGKDIEIAAAYLYLSIFEKCLRKARKNKHEKYILDEFQMCDRKRLDFKQDDQCLDAHIEAVKQEAYRQVWAATGLPAGMLVAGKYLPFRIPMDLSPPTHFKMKGFR